MLSTPGSSDSASDGSEPVGPGHSARDGSPPDELGSCVRRHDANPPAETGPVRRKENRSLRPSLGRDAQAAVNVDVARFTETALWDLLAILRRLKQQRDGRADEPSASGQPTDLGTPHPGSTERSGAAALPPGAEGSVAATRSDEHDDPNEERR